MKRAIIGFGLFATATVFPLQAQSPAPPREPERVRLAYKDADLVDILQFYAHLTKRKVWIEPGLQLRVSVMTSRDVPRAEALSPTAAPYSRRAWSCARWAKVRFSFRAPAIPAFKPSFLPLVRAGHHMFADWCHVFRHRHLPSNQTMKLTATAMCFGDAFFPVSFSTAYRLGPSGRSLSCSR